MSYFQRSLFVFFGVVGLAGCATGPGFKTARSPELEPVLQSIGAYSLRIRGHETQDNCTSLASPPSAASSKLARLLEEGQSRYATAEDRAKDPEKYVAVLDQIIDASDYRFLLACRDLWRDHGAYKIRFIKPGESGQMQVESEERPDLPEPWHRALIMAFNPQASFQRILFTYMHELTHVCQARDSRQIYLDLLSHWEGEHAFQQERSNRDFLANEVQAFMIMQAAHRDLTRVSRRLCFEEEPRDPKYKDDPPLAQVYHDEENDVAAGTFAQQVIYDYNKDSHAKIAGVVDENSKPQKYPKSSWGPPFQLRCLTRQMLQELNALKIPVVEPDCGN